MSTRLSVNINDQTAVDLKVLAATRFLEDAVRDGKQIQIVEPCTCRNRCRDQIITRLELM